MSGFRFLCFHLLIQQQLVEMGERQAAFWPDFSKLPGATAFVAFRGGVISTVGWP